MSFVIDEANSHSFNMRCEQKRSTSLERIAGADEMVNFGESIGSVWQ